MISLSTYYRLPVGHHKTYIKSFCHFLPRYFYIRGLINVISIYGDEANHLSLIKNK